MVSWNLFDGDKKLLEGSISSEKILNISDVSEVAYIHFDLPEVKSPKSLILKVSLDETDFTNSCPIFIYPKPYISNAKIGVFDPANSFVGVDSLHENVSFFYGETGLEKYDVVFTSHLNGAIKTFAQNGGKVFCMQNGSGVIPTDLVAFWREGMIRT